VGLQLEVDEVGPAITGLIPPPPGRAYDGVTLGGGAYDGLGGGTYDWLGGGSAEDIAETVLFELLLPARKEKEFDTEAVARL